MFPNLLSALTVFSVISAHAMGASVLPAPKVLAEHVMPMNDRYTNSFVSNVFKDNILLTMAYMDKTVTNGTNVPWDKVESPFTYSFTLKPHETFAFHDQLMPSYVGKVVRTTNAHFSSYEGYKSDGYLVADGVCHLASFMNWVAKDANLTVEAPTNHDFAVIPDIARQYGTAIYFQPDAPGSSELQNLYVTNNQEKPVTFVFTYKDSALDLKITQEK